jgi:hypothetical protein
MNRDSQKRKISRFLEGKGKKDLDAFCIYQWIDRCHYEGWWDICVNLGNYIPPNSLNYHYHKRLDFLLDQCREHFEGIKTEFVKLKNPKASESFFLPKFFWNTCREFKIQLGGRSNRGLRLEFLGKHILFTERIDMNGCVFCFFNMDSDELNSWLNSHGFGHLVQGIIWPRKTNRAKRSRLKISWQEGSNLIPSLIEEAKSDLNVIFKMFFEAFYEIKDGSWSTYLHYVREKYALNLPDEGLMAIRSIFTRFFTENGNESLAKRLNID